MEQQLTVVVSIGEQNRVHILGEVNPTTIAFLKEAVIMAEAQWIAAGGRNTHIVC